MEQDPKITKAQFKTFQIIQELGYVNMATPQAKEMVDKDMSKEDFFYLLANYRELEKIYK
tara:strand:- start:592 stop:771 length:180 start_codon:yes stop_codon:yes gene_type:complete